MANLPKNATSWTPPSGKGYVTPSSGGPITTQSGVDILTQSKSTIILNPNVVSPLYATGWTQTTKNASSWRPESGIGYVVTVGNLDFVDNSGNFIVDNSGNNIVTTPTYVTSKNATSWSMAAAS